LASAGAIALLALPLCAQAQGIVRGTEEGARAGDHAAGPVGAVVGGAVGAVTGTVGGILGVDDRPRFREYVVTQRPRIYQYPGEIRVGTVLPGDVRYYDVPAEYHVPAGYVYAFVNNTRCWSRGDRIAWSRSSTNRPS
jgi:hypothetical protein